MSDFPNKLFENVELEGVGNIRIFATLSTAEVQSRLSTDRYALYCANAVIPHGWPSEAMRNQKATLVEDHKQIDVNQWYMNLDGKKWRLFYGFCLRTYLDELKLIPAFIYERKTFAGALCYRPVVSMLLFPDGGIRQASMRWCDAVLADRLKE